MTSKTTHPYYLPNQLIRSFEHYKKKGDIGKLININPSLRSESEGTAWNITVNIIDTDGGKPSEYNNVCLVINANTIGGVKPFAGTKKADAKATRQYPAVTLAFYGDTTFKLDVPEKKDRIQQYGKAKILLYQAMKKKVGDLIKAGFFGDEEVKMTNGNSQIQTSYKNEKKKVVKIEDQGKYVIRVTIPVKPEDNTFYTTIYDGSKPLPEEGDDDKSKGKSKGKSEDKSEQSQNINFDIATIEDKKDKKKRVLVGPGNIHLFIPNRTTVVFGLDHMTQLKLFNGGLSVPSKFRNEIALIPLTGKVSTMGSTLSKFIKVDTLKSSAKSSKKASSNSDGDDDENVENEDNDEENNEEGSGENEDNEGNEEDNEEEGNEDDVEEADEEEVEVVKKASKSSKSSNAKSKKSAPAKKAKKPAKKVAEEEEEELSE